VVVVIWHFHVIKRESEREAIRGNCFCFVSAFKKPEAVPSSSPLYTKCVCVCLRGGDRVCGVEGKLQNHQLITFKWCLNLNALSHSEHLNFRKSADSSWDIIWRCKRYTLANVLWHNRQHCKWEKDGKIVFNKFILSQQQRQLKIYLFSLKCALSWVQKTICSFIFFFALSLCEKWQ
jgi:hypothetical protein